jgi:hypothetical protein
MDIIKALKENERPFGLMSEAMQVKAREIKGDNWLGYEGMSIGEWKPRDIFVDTGDFVDSDTYRLRPDYDPKPENVECEVYVDGEDKCLCYRRTDKQGVDPLSCAVDDPDFIGFKYAGGVVSTSPRHFYDGVEGEQTWQIYESKLLTKYEVLTPTHCLFRKG